MIRNKKPELNWKANEMESHGAQTARWITGTNIAWTVPNSTDVTTLALTFTLSGGATAIPVSGTTRNFTTPQTYTVTSSDSLITKVYAVTVTKAPVSSAKGILILLAGTAFGADGLYSNGTIVSMDAPGRMCDRP